MNCAEYQERASLILDSAETLSAEDVNDVIAHLSICSTCDLDHALDRATRTVLRQRFPMVETPVQVRQSIQNFIAQQYAV
jgi:hypothetical protein